MAILYVYKINDPNNVGPYPPSVNVSEWGANMAKYFHDHGLSGEYLIFPNESELDNFLATFRITDPVLLADIELWKSEHGVTYVHEFYDLSTPMAKAGIHW